MDTTYIWKARTKWLHALYFVIMFVLLWEGVTSQRRAEVMSQRWAGMMSQEYSLSHLDKIRELEERAWSLTIQVNSSGIHLWQPHLSMYQQVKTDVGVGGGGVGGVGVGGGGVGGVGVVVVEGVQGKMVLQRSFHTHQPGEHQALRDCLAALQPSRLLLLAAMPPFLPYLWPDGGEALEDLGATLLPKVAHGEPWAMVVVTGEPGGRARVLGEAMATKEMVGGPEGRRNPTVILEIHEVKFTGSWCGEKAEGVPSTGSVTSRRVLTSSRVVTSSRVLTSSGEVTSEQARFCVNYDGYGDLCRCHLPFLPHAYPSPPSFPTSEDIPVVVVTANKPYHLYRLLRNLLLWVEGGGETKVLVVVDGPHQETLDLVRLFQVEVVVHDPQGPPGENTRTNTNIAFALASVFSRWSHVDKAIVLEDDLVLAPDLLRYFHYTAPALTTDPTLYLVSAWGQNSYPSTARDPSVVHRVQGYPQYGWMTTRAWATYVLPRWAPHGGGVDWDWWLYTEGVRAGLEVLVPEVSRTAHLGSAGAHVTGWEQHLYFSHRLTTATAALPPTPTPTSTPTPYSLMSLHTLVGGNYSAWLEEDIKAATKVTLQAHPCHTHPVPPATQGPFVLYLGMVSRSDEYNSFYLLQACLGTDDQEVKELYEGVMRLRVRPYAHDRTLAARTALHTYAHAVLHNDKGRGDLGVVLGGQGNVLGDQEGESQVLYLVGCPLSPYCRHSAGTSDWLIPGPPVLEEAMKVARRRRMAGVRATHRIRIAGDSPEQEFHLDNLRQMWEAEEPTTRSTT